MSQRTIVQIDADTGELLRGTMVWVEDKPKVMGHFVKTYQNGLVALAAYRFTGETYSVMLYLMGKLSFDNWINVTQADIGNSLGLAQQNVSRAMKVLVEKKVILEGPRKGRCHTYRLNYAIGYKGDEGRQTKGGFRVLDGGRKKDGTPAFRVLDENGYAIPQKPAPKEAKDPKPSAPDSEPV
jgi:hypothetical protein